MGEGMMSSAHQDTLKRAAAAIQQARTPENEKNIYARPSCSSHCTAYRPALYGTSTHTHRSRSASQRIYTASLILVNLIRILFCISFLLLFFLYILYIYQSSSFRFYISIQGANYSRFLHSFFHPATPFRLYYAVELYHV